MQRIAACCDYEAHVYLNILDIGDSVNPHNLSISCLFVRLFVYLCIQLAIYLSIYLSIL